MNIPKSIKDTYQLTESNCKSLLLPQDMRWTRLHSLLNSCSYQTHFNFKAKRREYYLLKGDHCLTIRRYGSPSYSVILIKAQEDGIMACTPLHETSRKIETIIEKLFDHLNREPFIPSSSSSSSTSMCASSSLSSLIKIPCTSEAIIENRSLPISTEEAVKIRRSSACKVDEVWISIFTYLDFESWKRLPCLNTILGKLAKNISVIISLFNGKQNLREKTILFLNLIPELKKNRILKLNLSHLTSKICNLDKILSLLPNLQEINLSYYRFYSKDEGEDGKEFYSPLDDTALKKLKFPSGLTSLNLSGSWITDKGLKFLSQELISLSLENCYSITGAGFKSLSPKLQNFILHGCFKVDDAGIKELPQELIALDLSGEVGTRNDSITNQGIQELPLTLQFLNLFNCTKISTIGLSELRHRIPDCEIVCDLTRLQYNTKLDQLKREAIEDHKRAEAQPKKEPSKTCVIS